MVHTTRFGDIEVAPENVLDFPDGLIGLGGTEYALVPAPHGPFIWLQSLTEPGVALPLAPPERFFTDFKLELDEDDQEHVQGAERVDVYVTVRAAPVAADCTANLKAPIVVVGDPAAGPRQAYQVLNRDSAAALRTPLFAAS